MAIHIPITATMEPNIMTIFKQERRTERIASDIGDNHANSCPRNRKK